MMERDRRLTGSLRGQSVRAPFSGRAGMEVLTAGEQTEPVAPKAFATNSVWQTEKVTKAFI